MLLAAALAGALAAGGALAVLSVTSRPDPARPQAVRLDPAHVAGCEQSTGTVVLDRAAPDEGVAVALESTSPVVRVPDDLEVPAGATSASFPVETEPVARTEHVEVRATLAGGTAGAALRLEPAGAAAAGADAPPACRAAFREHHGYAPPERAGAFDAERIPEASGLAASRRNPGWLYLVDDGGPREVWAVRTDGRDLHPLPLAGFRGRDTEALAVGPCAAGADGQAAPDCVFVGDVGDNLSTHPDVAILRFPEPVLPASPAGDGASPITPDVIRVRYPDGPVDAEALLVDDAGVPHLVTKEAGADGAGAARLFAAPGFADGTLTDLGPVPLPEPRVGLVASVLGVVVTGADDRDGRVLLRTYDHAVEFVAPDPAAPLGEFPSWPAREVPATREPQSEAIAFAAKGCGYYTAGEGVGDLWFAGCRR